MVGLSWLCQLMEIVMDENEFEFRGKMYVCVDDFGRPCTGCAFINKDFSCFVSKEKSVPWCEGVIFTEKQA